MELTRYNSAWRHDNDVIDIKRKQKEAENLYYEMMSYWSRSQNDPDKFRKAKEIAAKLDKIKDQLPERTMWDDIRGILKTSYNPDGLKIVKK